MPTTPKEIFEDPQLNQILSTCSGDLLGWWKALDIPPLPVQLESEDSNDYFFRCEPERNLQNERIIPALGTIHAVFQEAYAYLAPDLSGHNVVSVSNFKMQRRIFPGQADRNYSIYDQMAPDIHRTGEMPPEMPPHLIDLMHPIQHNSPCGLAVLLRDEAEKAAIKLRGLSEGAIEIGFLGGQVEPNILLHNIGPDVFTMRVRHYYGCLYPDKGGGTDG